MAVQWTVAQIGAREHYAVAIALERRGSLAALYTDAWSRRSLAPRAWYPAGVNAMLARRTAALPDAKVRSFTPAVLRRELARTLGRGTVGLYERFIETGQWFANAVCKDLDQRSVHPDRDAFFGYNTGCLEVFEHLRDRGVLCVVDQIDPARVEEALVREERERWPEWEASAPAIPEAYWQRLQTEWALADRVVVNSDWSRTALEQQGVPRDKLAIVPLAYEPPDIVPPRVRSESGGRPLLVLWLGTVSLRKGIPYLLEAARLVLNENVKFVVAGPVLISPTIVGSAPRNVEFTGRITRSALTHIYAEADVFVLPTISDGFAITQLEAMAHGLPVVTTPNCGEVVTNGVDGFVVAPRDVTQLAAAIGCLANDRELVETMSAHAVRRARDFSLSRIATLIEELSSRESRVADDRPERHVRAIR